MLISLFNRNRDTFYNYLTNEKEPPNKIYLFTILTSIISTFTINELSIESLSIVVSVFSILIGFGFTSQFFLVDKKFIIDGSNKFIEKKQLEEKIKKLSGELFINVSYFNVVSLTLVIICIFHTINIDNEILTHILSILHIKSLIEFSPFIGRFSISILMIESLYTFYRILQRTHYLFSKVRPEF